MPSRPSIEALNGLLASPATPVVDPCQPTLRIRNICGCESTQRSNAIVRSKLSGKHVSPSTSSSSPSHLPTGPDVLWDDVGTDYGPGGCMTITVHPAGGAPRTGAPVT